MPGNNVSSAIGRSATGFDKEERIREGDGRPEKVDRGTWEVAELGEQRTSQGAVAGGR
jgi:hypothetical protein